MILPSHFAPCLKINFLLEYIIRPVKPSYKSAKAELARIDIGFFIVFLKPLGGGVGCPPHHLYLTPLGQPSVLLLKYQLYVKGNTIALTNAGGPCWQAENKENILTIRGCRVLFPV